MVPSPRRRCPQGLPARQRLLGAVAGRIEDVRRALRHSRPGYSRTDASLIIGGVALIVLFAALAAGKLADRSGRLRVLWYALPVYDAGFLVPFVTTSPALVAAAVPFMAVWRRDHGTAVRRADTADARA